MADAGLSLPWPPPVPLPPFPPPAPPFPLPAAPAPRDAPAPADPVLPAAPADHPVPAAPPPPALSLRMLLVVASLEVVPLCISLLFVSLFVPDFDRIDDGLWSRTQSLFARPVRLTHSLGMSLRIVEPGGVVAFDGVVGVAVVCAPAVAAIANVIAVASNPCFHVFMFTPWSQFGDAVIPPTDG